MLKACRYCGKIHDSKIDCGKKPKRKTRKRCTEKDRFRSTRIWTKKSIEIRKRDHNLCQACLMDWEGTMSRLNCNRLSVHHIIPLEEDREQRLNNENLITLCDRHHEMAETGEIPRVILIQIAKKNNTPGEAGNKKNGCRRPTAYH